MKRIIFLLLLLFISSCAKEKVDENHYFISAFNFVLKKQGDNYPMELRCDFMIHLYHDSVQLYQNTKNEVFWSEKIKVNKKEIKLIKSILKKNLSEAQIVEYPINGTVCGPWIKGPYFFGSISSLKGDLYNPININNYEKIKNRIIKKVVYKKGKFSSLLYKEMLFHTSWMNLNNTQENPENIIHRQIQFLPPVVE